MIYEIYDGNMARMHKAAQKIGKKCEKYGLPFKFEIVNCIFKEVNGEIARFFLVDVEGTAANENWEFIASVDKTDSGNVFRKVVDVEIPERYYYGDIICEHCGQNRARKYAYIVRNVKSGEFKMVGKACLKEFTGGISAESIAAYISMFNELIKGSAVPDRIPKTWYSVKSVIASAVSTFNKHGYVGHSLSEYDEECEEKADEIIAWMKTFSDDNDYSHNIKVLAENGYCNDTHFYMIRKVADEYLNRKESKFVGEIGDKVSFEIAKSVTLTSWATAWGKTYMYRFEDKKGNVYIWKTSKYYREKDRNCLRGIVKEHNEFRGTKQTVLTRCHIA